ADGARANADEAAKTAEGRVVDALAQWNATLARASDPTAGGVDLAAAAAEMRQKGREATSTLREALAGAATEIASRAGATGRGEAGRERVRGLEGRMRMLQMRGEGAVRDAVDRGAKALVEGEAAYKDGRFHVARPLLEEAVRLSFEGRDEIVARAEQARRRLSQVESYVRGVEKAMADLDAAVQKGDHAEGWRIGCLLL